MIEIYTDGAYSSARKQGGLAIIFLKNNKEIAKYSKAYKNTTNNRMELLAVIIGLESVNSNEDIIIYSDSMYVIGTATMNWKRTKNVDLWNRFFKIYNPEKHKFVHVKGHADNIYNNKCDELAVMESQWGL